MKLQKFSAEDVHGYLPIDIAFHPDVTFVTGLNGTGKTSALRIIMGLLTPVLSELAEIAFSSATLEIETPEGPRVIRAHKKEGNTLSLEVTGCREKLVTNVTELLRFHEFAEVENRGSLELMSEHFVGGQVLREIAKISTPMFLGLTRAQFRSQNLWRESPASAHRRKILLRQNFEGSEEVEDEYNNTGQGLLHVQHLVRNTMSEIRAQLEGIEKKLRQQILSEALRYIPFKIGDVKSVAPNRAMIERLRGQERDIAAIAARLELPELQRSVRDFSGGITNFFERLEATPGATAQERQPKRMPSDPLLSLEWLMNKAQADRVISILEAIERYTADRNKRFEPIDRFVNIVNKFFDQTGKRVKVADNGSLNIQRNRKLGSRRISNLSSGEQQILIMLAHLALNPQLADSGVFIVDEPELSLHISWQEIFVDAILEANPNCQVVLATHSPAIILDRDDKCVTLGVGGNR